MYYLVQTILHPKCFYVRQHLATTIYDINFNVVGGKEFKETTKLLKSQGNFDTIYHGSLLIFLSDSSDKLD